VSVVLPRRHLALACLLVSTLVAASACSGDGEDPSGEPSTADSAVATQEYVALGDSYTSAPGVPETVDAGCLRSDANYPALVAEELDLALRDVSCGGASVTSLIGVQETSTGPRAPQFNALTTDTDLVTLGIGGNDEGLFSLLFVECVRLGAEQRTGSPCRDLLTQGEDGTVLDTIAVIQERLTSALLGIKDRAPDADVVLVGYPQLVPDRIRCDVLPLTPADYRFVRTTLVAMGRATQQAAEDAGVRYVDLLAASAGHDVCAGEDAWVRGVVDDPAAPGATMHPFAEEQVAVAQLVVEALED